MSSRNEKTIRQIREILQTTDDYEKKERNLSQNSPFSCYLTPRANLYNQYPYRIPLWKKSTKKSTKKRRAKNTLDDFTSNPFLFNNSNPIYHQLSNSAKKAFLPYTDTRLSSYSKLNSSSNLRPNKHLQTQSVQTSLALILDQSDSLDDPITAKQNDILSFISISEKLLLKKIFNRWRQRWFFQTAYTAQKLIQTTGFSTLSHHSRRSLHANDSQSKEKLAKNDLESQKLALTDEHNHKTLKSRHHHSTSQSNKNLISQSANKRLTQTEIHNKKVQYNKNGDNSAINSYEEYEYTEYDDTNQNNDKNRQIHRHHRSKRLETRESNDKDQYDGYEYEYEYENDFDTGSEKTTKRRRRISKKEQNRTIQKMSKTAKTQTDKALLENSKRNDSIDLKSKTYNPNSKRNDEYNDIDDSDFLNDQNLLKPMLQINDKSGTYNGNSLKNKQSYNNSNTNTKVSQNFFDDSSTSLIDDRNQFQPQKLQNSSQKNYSLNRQDDEEIDHHSSLLNSPIKSKQPNKVSQDLLDLSSDSFLDGIDLYKPQTTKSSTQKNSMLFETNENSRYSKKNSLTKNRSDSPLTDSILGQREKNSIQKDDFLLKNNESYRNSNTRKSSTTKTKENDSLFVNQNDSISDSSSINLIVPKMTKQKTTTNSSIQRNSSLLKSEENNRTNQYSKTNNSINNKNNSASNSRRNSPSRSRQNDSMNANPSNNASNSRRNSPSRSRQNGSMNANQSSIDYSNEALNQQKSTNSTRQKSSSLLRSEESTRNSQYNSTVNNSSNSRRYSPSRKTQNDSLNINQNYIDYSHDSINETQNQTRQQQAQNSTLRSSSHVRSEENNRSGQINNNSNINISASNARRSGQNDSRNAIHNYSDYSDDDQNMTLQQRRSISTQKNLSSAISEENDQYYHNSRNQNNSDFSDEQLNDNRSKRQSSAQRKSSIIETSENRRKRRNNSPTNNSSDYQNNSDYSVGYANTEQDANRRRNFSRKLSANQSRTKEFTFADSKTFSPIKTPKNFDEVASQIIPDLDEFIEKFSTKTPNYSLDDESDIEFKSLIEKSRYFKSKYSHLSLDDFENENNRSSAAFRNLIPVDTSLDPNANASSFNRNNNSTLHELHVFDHEMTEENGSPPLYFNE